MATVDDIAAVLKYITPYKEVQRQWYENWDFMKWLPTRSDFGGRKLLLPLSYDAGGGHSHDFAAAQAQEANPNQYGEFQIDRTRLYDMVYVDYEAIEASEGDKNGFLDTLEESVQGADSRCKTTTAYEMWDYGGGAAAKITVTTPGANGVLTLQDPEQIFRFALRQQVQASVDDGVTGSAGVKGGSPGYMTITAMDEDAGTLTVDNTTFITGLATNDFLIPRGNYQKALKGVPFYIPDATHLAASPTAWGLNRAVAPSKLAGIRFTGTSFGLAESLERLLLRCRRSGIYPDAIWVNHTYYTALSLDLGAKAQRDFVRIGQFGFDTINVFAYGRKVPVMSDQNVPSGFAYALTRNSWVWHTLKEAPRWLTMGATSIVKPSADGIEARRGWRGQLVCRAPWANAVGSLPTL